MPRPAAEEDLSKATKGTEFRLPALADFLAAMPLEMTLNTNIVVDSSGETV
jgi:hypothetical protein